MGLILRWVAGVIALYITVYLAQTFGVHLGMMSGGTNGIIQAFIVIAALTLVNAFIRPIVNLLTLPLNCLTFGLFSFVVNAIMFWLVGQFHLGLEVKDWIAALFGSVVLSIVSGLLNHFVAFGEKNR